ncbi:MAG: substrate-binding domain-containing protein [Patescibacteria group bacterium]
MGKSWFFGLRAGFFACLIAASLFAPDAAAGGTIGVALLTREHRFYQELEAGLRRQAYLTGYRLTVCYGEFDHIRQSAQVASLIAKKVKALIVAPCDSIAIGQSIIRANKAGIPVFTVDIANLSGKGRVVSHIASDNREGGRLAGTLMAEALKGAGKVVVINHPNVTSVMDRVRNFKEYLRAYPRIEIVADIPAWGQRDRAMAIMEDLLLMLPELKGVFAINDDSALGAATAIEAAGRGGEIVIVGYDGTPEAQRAIDEGRIYGDVIQYPQEIGRLAMIAVRDHFAGRRVQPHIPVPVGVYTGGGREE